MDPEIQKIQTQLRQAIQSHQMVLIKLKQDPQNSEMKLKLSATQKTIIQLGETQKLLVQKLRKELEAKNAQQSTISNHHTARSSQVVWNNNNNNNNNATENVGEKKSDSLPQVRYPQGTPAHMLPGCKNRTPTDLVRDTPQELYRPLPICTYKLDANNKEDFLMALDLLTPQHCKELVIMQNERRKRLAVNPIFASELWELPEKRKKANYLQTSSPPVLRNRIRPHSEEPSPINSRSSSPDEEVCQRTFLMSSHWHNSHEVEDLRVSPGSEYKSYSSSSPLPGHCSPIPAETPPSRVKNEIMNGYIHEHARHEDCCAVCSESGTLIICDTCRLLYHPRCVEVDSKRLPSNVWSCPRCVREEKKVLPNGTIAHNNHVSWNKSGTSCSKEAAS